MANPILKDDLIGAGVMEALEAMDARLKSIAENLGKLEKATITYAQAEAQGLPAKQNDVAALTEEAKRISELEEMVKKLQAAKKTQTDMEKALAAEKRKYAKLTEEEAASVKNLRTELKWLNDADKDVVNYVKEKIQNLDVENKSYNELQQTYNALRDTINRLTPEQLKASDTGKILAGTGLRVREAMNEMQQATGNYTLQVGKYKAAFDGLGYSFMQIAREAPSALNLDQFFLAISNNIPLFFDQVERFKTEQATIKQTLADLEAQGKQTSEEYIKIAGQQTTVFKRLTTAIFSLQGAVLVFTLLLRFLPKIVDWVKTLVKSTKDWYTALGEVRRQQSEIFANAENQVANTAAEIKLLVNDIKNATRGTQEWVEYIGRVNELTNSNLDATTATVKQVEAVTDAYLRQQRQIAINNEVVKKYAANDMKQYALGVLSEMKEDVDADLLIDMLGLSDDDAKKLKENYKEAINDMREARAELGSLEAEYAVARRTGTYTKEELSPGLDGPQWRNVTKTVRNLPDRELSSMTELSNERLKELAGGDDASYNYLLAMVSRARAASKGGIGSAFEEANSVLEEMEERTKKETAALEAMYNALYTPQQTGRQTRGKEKTEKAFDFSPSDVDDKYWEAEKERVRQMEEGYKREIELQRVAHAQMLEENDVWLGKREEQLMDNLMGELKLLTEGNDKAADEMYNAIVRHDTEAIQQMGSGAQALAEKYWDDIEEGERQHSVIMQGLVAANAEAIKAINMKYDKERMKQIEEAAKSEMQSVQRRVRTTTQEQQRNAALAHNIEVLIEEQRKLTTENYLEADSMEEAEKKAAALGQQIEKLQNQVDHSRKLSNKFSFGELVKDFAIDNTTKGTARKTAERLIGDDAYKAYDARIQGAEAAQERAAQFYGVDSEEYKKAAEEVKAANKALDDAVAADWEVIVDNTVAGVQEWGSQMLSLYQEMIQAEIDLANAKVEAAKKSTEAAQEEYDKEKALLEAGYANRVETTWAEYQEKQAAQAAAEAAAKAAAKRAKDLETAQQAINMVGASIDTYKAFAGIPAVGPALGIAAVAAMWALFASAKSRAAQAAQYGKGGFEVLEGGSHASGHDIDLGVNNRRGRRMHAEGREGLGIFSISAMNHYGTKNIEQWVKDVNNKEFETNVGRTLTIERGLGLHKTTIMPRTNLHRLESAVERLVAASDRRQYVEADGTVVEQSKYGTTRIKRR